MIQSPEGLRSLSELFAVICSDEDQREQAQALAQQCALPLCVNTDLVAAKSRERLRYFQSLLDGSAEKTFALLLEEGKLSLLNLNSAVLVTVDFCEGKADHRRRFGGGSGQMIAKAVGIKGKLRPRVLDATAGLGQDSFVMASLGAEVLMLERSIVVQHLLGDGLQRARQQAEGDAELAEIIGRMQLKNIDSRQYLLELSTQSKADESTGRPHVVYLDPMFPERKKAAQVKKEMQSFHQVVGQDPDADELLSLAREVALARVVVKRPKHADYLAGCEADYQISGKSSRYDIYVNRALESFFTDSE